VRDLDLEEVTYLLKLEEVTYSDILPGVGEWDT
jgi:hypothetical protein